MVPAVQLGFIVENIGGGEIVVIAFLVLVVLGPDRIPELARGAGRMLHNLKKFSQSMSGDMQGVMNDPSMQPIRELGEFASRPRQKLAEYALEAEAEERQRQAEQRQRAAGASDGSPEGEAAEAGEVAGSPEGAAAEAGASAGSPEGEAGPGAAAGTGEPDGTDEAEHPAP
jgi:sec-independent protein translocase protein TatB